MTNHTNASADTRRPSVFSVTLLLRNTNRSFTPSGMPALLAWACMMCLVSSALASEIIVTNLANGGAGSLRAAVASANKTPGRDLIRFGKHLKGTIKLTSGQIEITDSLTITGPGASRLTVSGNKASRIFKIATGAVVAIEKLTIADGRNTIQESVPILVTRGGAILNDGGTLSLSRVTMRNNVTINNGDSLVVGGGAIVNSGFSTLAATNCQFIDNIAHGGTGYAFGGAIGSVTESVATVENCSFTGNLATSGGTSYGGAIGNFGGSDLTVIDCTFFDNTARGTDSGEKAFGGAIATRPGTGHDSGSLTTIESSLLVANLAIGADGGEGQAGADAGGGALFNFASTLVTESSILFGNEAEGGNGVLGGGSAFGGAIHASGTNLSFGELVEIRCCQFFANMAVGGSPGREIGGQALGGALHNASPCQMDLRHSAISGNWALGAQDGQGTGGGLYTLGTTTADEQTIRSMVANKASTSDDNLFGTVTVD
ncbi:MAG: hypothetical protein ACO398_11320 [Kiritimatiellia bacterium]